MDRANVDFSLPRRGGSGYELARGRTVRDGSNFRINKLAENSKSEGENVMCFLTIMRRTVCNKQLRV